MTEHLSVLHICGDYSNQKLYIDLVSHLDAAGIRQCIYVPVRSQAELGVNQKEGLKFAQYRYAHILKPWHRLFFRAKIRAILKDIGSNIALDEIDVVHAHFLYSDGAAALKLFQRFRIPYVVAVRNTDINYFMRLRPDLKYLCWDILRHAHRVVFVTPCYRDLLLQRLPAFLRDQVGAKSVIVPNGLSDFWLENLHTPNDSTKQNIRLLYVGDFSKNKNIPNILKAAKLLVGHQEISLSLVGSGGDGESLVDEMLASGEYPFAKRLGRIDDRQALLSIYRDHDILVMPSFRETFGIAYIEALSQGLPVIFSKGQGIDGYFSDGEIGESVDPHDVVDMQRKIESVIRRLPALREVCVKAAQKFNWREITSTFADIYQGAVSIANTLRWVKN